MKLYKLFKNKIDQNLETFKTKDEAEAFLIEWRNSLMNDDLFDSHDIESLDELYIEEIEGAE